jgi:hypothetical protein
MIGYAQFVIRGQSNEQLDQEVESMKQQPGYTYNPIINYQGSQGLCYL